MIILVNLPDGTDVEMRFPASVSLEFSIAQATLTFPNWTSMLITIVRGAS